MIEVVKVANHHLTPLYPFGTGKNWGLGSKLPVVDGCILIDLKKMNRIIEVNEKLCYAVIEPGVTQKQLHDELEARQLPLMLSVTGSGAHTSIVGNTLDRGVGVLGQRTQDLRELEVVLGTGEIIKTGYQHYFNDRRGDSFYSYGLGPDLLHLFTQSNLAIVSNMTIDLVPKRNVTVVLIETPKDKVGAYIDKLAALRRSGELTDSIELTTQNDPRLLGLAATQDFDPDAWITWLKIYHRKPTIGTEIRETLASELGSLVRRITYFGGEQAKETLPDAVRFRDNAARGIPTNYSLDTMAKMFGVETENGDLDVDHHKQIPGFVCLLPAVPFHGEGVIDAVRAINRVSGRLGCSPAITLSAIGKYALEGFARVYFDRSDEAAVERAHTWARESLAELREIGLHPYRINVEDMSAFVDVRDPFWSLVKRIKQVCDPNGILAPGRYCPL